MKKFPGQSLTEYGIIISLVVVVAIGGIMAVWDALTGSFSSIMPSKPVATAPADTDNPAASTDDVVASGPDSEDTTVDEPVAPPVEGTGPAPIAQLPPGTYITTGKGTQISLPTYPPNLGKAVSTMGANGATNLLASNMASAAKQLYENGDIDKKQYDALIALANQASRLGDLQKKIEDGLNSSKSSMDFQLKYLLTMMGGSDSKATWEIGYRTGTGIFDATKVTDPLNGPSPGAETQKLLDLYQQVIASGAMDDPAVAAMVTSMTTQVAYLGEVVACAGLRVLNGQQSPKNALAQQVSEASFMDAKGLCSLGGGSSDGVNCVAK